MDTEIVHVAVAAIVNSNNEILISQRPPDVHQGGLWEFPGGKLEYGESVQQALMREINEELDLVIKSSRPLIKITHQYDDKTVLLDVWKVDDYSGDAFGKEGQAIKWQAVNQLDPVDFPAADVSVIQSLKLPEHYMITGEFDSPYDFKRRLVSAIEKGIQLVQLRITNDWLQESTGEVATEIIKIASDVCKQYKVRLMLNVPDELDYFAPAFCLHLNSRKLKQYTERPECEYLSVSCHTEQEMKAAQALGADFIVLSPVQATRSHPDASPLGWKKFSEMIAPVNIPVYALGGVSKDDTEKAWSAGAQGIAAVGALWNQA